MGKKQNLWCKSVLGSIHITTVCGKQRSAKNDFELNAGALMKIQFRNSNIFPNIPAFRDYTAWNNAIFSDQLQLINAAQQQIPTTYTPTQS